MECSYYNACITKCIHTQLDHIHRIPLLTIKGAVLRCLVLAQSSGYFVKRSCSTN